MIKAIIVDTDLNFIESFKKTLADNCPEIELVATLSGLKNFSKLILKSNPELIFLDAHLLDNFISELKIVTSENNFEFIALSKEDKYAIKAIKYGAFDYLTKPLKKDDLVRVADKIQRKRLNNKIIEQYALLMAQVKQSRNNNHNLAIPTIDGFVFFNMDDIVRLEASGSYTNIYPYDRQKVVSSKNIKEFEFQLPKEFFFRVHNSHIININRLVKYDKGRGGVLTMQDGSKITVSSRRKIQFLNLFK